MIAIRPATEADLVFVVESWQESYQHADCAGLITVEDWPDIMRGQLRKVIGREGMVVLVAYHPKATPGLADVMGWLAYERDYLIPLKRKVGGRHRREMVKCDWPLVHYCFVKQGYRRPFGVAKALLKAAGIDRAEPMHISCRTGVVNKLGLTRAKFDPKIARHTRAKGTENEARQQQTIEPARADPSGNPVSRRRARHRPKSGGVPVNAGIPGEKG